MRNIIVKLLIVLTIILGLVYTLSYIDFINLLKLKETKNDLEIELDKIIVDYLELDENRIKNYKLRKETEIYIDSILNEIKECNNLTIEIKVHIFESNIVNAFALPNNRIVIYTGLLKEAENREEILGIIAHELSHITKNHHMKKIISEFSLSFLVGLTTGKNDNQIKEFVKQLTSLSYSRELETEADIKAIEYLDNCNKSSLPLADFLFRIETFDRIELISTHPISENRIQTILELNKINYNTIDSSEVLKLKKLKENL